MIDLKSLPSNPGVYIYRNRLGEIIYVGKAINLKKRISQYFQRMDALGPKTEALVSHIATVETKIVDSEISALILESKLIKKFKPKYNSLLKDDRSYQYICISRTELPYIFTAYNSTLVKNCDVYGPFPNTSAIKSLLKTIRRIFPFYNKSTHPKTNCLYCHLKLCPGPAPDSQKYRQTIGKIKKILSGHFKLLQKQLKTEMKNFSTTENFEAALSVRYQLESINYIVSGWRSIKNLFEQISLPEDKYSDAIKELITTLNPFFTLKQINRIECYDISQMGTKHFVGSMTVWQNGIIDNREYRKFKISQSVIANLSVSKVKQSRRGSAQTSSEEMSANDSAMIKEILFRRLQHPEWNFPDLIVVDGGKPQVSAGNDILSKVGATLAGAHQEIALIGLAKKFETIVIKLDDDWQQINLPKNSKALLLLEALRNEAHRFANRYRKELMKKTIS
ncbi:GIY-YIG nuclease family protein [Candidatus Shapirobacteria bacterium]|nr:GIY-YIG nuclease family protein [Candidatus Shapirobacteria bacterium]